MLLAGLTGGIASGKSLVAGVFQNLGAHLIDADRIVHELLEPGQPGWQRVHERFGPEVLLPDDTINRRKLGEIIFNDREKREWLNNCLHPMVFEAFRAQVRHVRDRSPGAVIIFDVALLIETGYDVKMDRVVVVYADREQQIERLMARDAFSREEALSRIKSQMPLIDKRSRADYIIDNSGSREETRRQAEEVFRALLDEEKTCGVKARIFC